MVVLVHEKAIESWTHTVWERLKVRTQGHSHVRRLLLLMLTTFLPCPFARQEAAGQETELLGRLRIVHHWNYIKVLRHAVAVLDTYPYGGCLTTLDALAHAVPIITLPSNLVRGR